MKAITNALSAIGLTLSLSLSLIPFSQPTQAQDQVKFVCNQSLDPTTGKRLPTTFAWTPRGKIAIIRWETTAFPSYSPERRCKEVSPRFQEAWKNGTINVLTNGFINNQPVICTAKEYGEGCHTLLITLRPSDDSRKFLDNLVAQLNGEQLGPPKHSGQNYKKINMRKFLETAPVEKE